MVARFDGWTVGWLEDAWRIAWLYSWTFESVELAELAGVPVRRFADPLRPPGSFPSCPRYAYQEH